MRKALPGQIRDFDVPRRTASSGRRFDCRQHVQRWTARDVEKWMNGLGDSVHPFVPFVAPHVTKGQHLFMLDDDQLMQYGVSSLGARKVLLQAVQLLAQFCDELPRECVHSLCARVAVSASSARATLRRAAVQKHSARLDRDTLSNMLNSIMVTLSEVLEHVKKLIFWLDRPPFEGLPEYTEMRTRTAKLGWEIARLAASRPKHMISRIDQIDACCGALSSECWQWVRGGRTGGGGGGGMARDPLALLPAHAERVVLRRHDKHTSWGVDLVSSFRGVHVISEVRVCSPADLCGRVDPGDEIIAIGHAVVIGWELFRVAALLGSDSDMDLQLVLKKRPDGGAGQPSRASEGGESRALAATMPGSRAAHMHATRDVLALESMGGPLIRRRSTSFAVQLKRLMDDEKEEGRGGDGERKGSVPPAARPRRVRRASVGVMCVGRGGEGDVHGDLLALLNETAAAAPVRVIKRARTMRHQPDGYVRSFVDNKLVREVEEDVDGDQLTFNVQCPSEWASIEVVSEAEAARAAGGAAHAKATDMEWAAPYSELPSVAFRAPAAHSNASAISLDSPSRMTSSTDEGFAVFASSPVGPGGVLPSASGCSIASTVGGGGSLMSSSMHSTSEWADAVREGQTPPLAALPHAPTPDVPCQLLKDKTLEGWVRRRKTGAEQNSTTNKWPKCWMVLRGPHIYLYADQFAKRADKVIAVARSVCAVEYDLKTSKKFVFRVSRSAIVHYFSCNNMNDMKNWMQKISQASGYFNNMSTSMQPVSTRVWSKSVSSIKGSDTESADDPQSPHYSTVTGMQSHRDLSSPVHHTLPRSSGLTRGRVNSFDQHHK